jgi:hypothetical protein
VKDFSGASLLLALSSSFGIFRCRQCGVRGLIKRPASTIRPRVHGDVQPGRLRWQREPNQFILQQSLAKPAKAQPATGYSGADGLMGGGVLKSNASWYLVRVLLVACVASIRYCQHASARPAFSTAFFSTFGSWELGQVSHKRRSSGVEQLAEKKAGSRAGSEPCFQKSSV